MIHLRSLYAVSLGAAVLLASACSDEDPPAADASVVTGMDAADEFDAGVDAGRPDRGVMINDAGSDAGVHYCTTANAVDVDGTNVIVGEASTPALTPSEAAAELSCLDDGPDPLDFDVTIFLRGCFTPIGAALTEAQLEDLEVDVFEATNRVSGLPNDPGFDAVTGQNRGTPVGVTHFFDPTIATSVCASGVQLEIGFNATDPALVSETNYIVRVRTASSAAAQVIPPTYYFGVLARNEGLGGAPLKLDTCTASQCYLRYNFVAATTAALTTAISAAPTAIPGSANLRDGLGSGYGLIEAHDCNATPMKHAVAGFNPAGLNDGYVGDTINLGATETTERGLYFALGFPGQTATASTALEVTAAVGVARDDLCTEEYAGGTITVFPDSVSVFRSSDQTVLHGR